MAKGPVYTQKELAVRLTLPEDAFTPRVSDWHSKDSVRDP